MKKIVTIIVVSFLLIFSGCEKFIKGYDVDPNNPSVVTPSLLLSNVELNVFATYGGAMARNSAILTQHMNGVSDQSRVIWANYNYKEGDITNEWLIIYTGILVNAQAIIDQFGDKDPYYAGIARIHQALGFGIATDFWGDIPMKEALKGLSGKEEDFSPHYDPQQTVIQGIQSLLDQAIVDLGKAPADNILAPGADDYIFNGNVELWKNTAWILKARYALRLSKRNPDAAQTALTYLSNMSASDNSMDANCIFGESANELNQWYAFQQARGGYMKMGQFFVDLLQNANDPRLPFYASPDLNGNYTGAPLGSQDPGASDIGPYIGSATSPVSLVSFEEAKFIEAEANFRLSKNSEAADSYNLAVITSVQKVTGALAPPEFVQAFASETAGSITLEKIMLQKYIALFSQVETYADWRRTNIPALSPNPSGVTTVIPRRFPTPQDERVNNLNAVVVSDITSPVWWDE